MQFYTNNITNPAGTALAGLSVRVQHTDGSAATIYSDNGVTPATNPLVTDGTGSFGFYAANGRYQLAISGNGIIPYTVRDILLYDPASDETDLVGKASNADLANTANGKGADLIANAAKKVASIAALKALRVPQGSDAQTVIVDGYASANDGGGGPFIWSATATNADDSGTVITPSSNPSQGRWLRLFSGPLNVLWFGAKTDYNSSTKSGTDNFNAFTNAIAATNTANSGMSRSLFVPYGNYWFSHALHLDRQVVLIGEGGSGFYSATNLYFPSGTHGIIVDRATTAPDGVSKGDWSVVKDIAIYGTRLSNALWAASHAYTVGTYVSSGGNTYQCTVAGTSGTTAPSFTSGTGTDGTVTWQYVNPSHGVVMYARAKFENCYITLFEGNGYNIVASSSGTPSTNANGWQIVGGRVDGVAGHGVFTQGGDSNAGLCQGLDIGYPDGYGIYDSSFLGNTYIGCQVANSVLGSYKSDNPNARNLFLGCYSEGGQPASSITKPAIFMGATQGSPVTGTGTIITDGRVQNLQWLIDSGATNQYQFMPQYSGPAVCAFTISGPINGPGSTGSLGYFLEKMNGWWGFMYGNSNQWQNIPFMFSDKDASDGPGFFQVPNALYLGVSGYGQSRLYSSTAQPASGTWRGGDFVMNGSPTETGTAGSKYIVHGWRCTVGGTPGTWVQVRTLTGN